MITHLAVFIDEDPLRVIFYHWKSEDYTSRRYKVSRERLNVLSGICNRFAQKGQGEIHVYSDGWSYVPRKETHG